MIGSDWESGVTFSANNKAKKSTNWGLLRLLRETGPRLLLRSARGCSRLLGKGSSTP